MEQVGANAKARKKAKEKRKTKARANARANANITLQGIVDPSPFFSHFFRPTKRFNILPQSVFHSLISVYADILPINYTRRYRYIQKHFPMNSPIAGIQSSFSLPIDPINTGWSKVKSIAIRKAHSRIMKCRMAFLKLLHHIRVRRLEKANVDDLLTGEPPKNPVNITVWNEMKVYIFEANTLMKDITERLLHNDGLFEYPQYPRNPFTNIPLTLSQMISVWNSISRASIPVSSAFALFRNSAYNMDRFIEENIIFLKLNSLRRTFKEAKSYDYTEKLLDFIEYSYHIESVTCSLISFQYALDTYPNHHIIRKWALLCEKYHSAEILHAGNPEKITKVKNAVLDDTSDILQLQRELITLRSIIENTSHTPEIIEAIDSLDFFLGDV
jgi:hypothetical protein